MKSRILSLCAILGVFSAAGAAYGADRPNLVRVPIREAFIPTGFDSNDRALIVIAGAFSNTCHRIAPQTVKVDEEAKTIVIDQGAFYYQGPCLMMLVEFNQTVQLGILKAGQYDIVDGASKRSLGTLPVAEAKSSDPDDHIYASIKDAYVTSVESGENIVVLKMTLPGTCWRLDEKRVLQEGKNVITVLPILAVRGDDNCIEQSFPYSTTVRLPKLNDGKYLLHVRSLEGQAITKLFDIQE
jgi:hypothetical protein